MTSRAMPPSGGNVSVAGAKKRAAEIAHRPPGPRTLPPIPQMLMLILLVAACVQLARGVYSFGAGSLPTPRGLRAKAHVFSEARARRHLTALLQMGPRPIGSSALHGAVQYVLSEMQRLQREADTKVEECTGDVVLDVDVQQLDGAMPQVSSGLGGTPSSQTHIYTDLKNIVCRVRKHKWNAESPDAHSILVTANLDTVPTSWGAGDAGSAVASMMEMVRAMVIKRGPQHAVVFLFTMGKHAGLTGAHEFITKHPWWRTVRMFVALGARGVGGEAVVFQAGPESWPLEKYSKVVPYPSGSVITQDMLKTGLLPEGPSDFQVFKEFGRLSGLEISFIRHPQTQYTKSDRLTLVRPGSLQHLGDNILTFIKSLSSSADLSLHGNSSGPDNNIDASRSRHHPDTIFFDMLQLCPLLGKGMVTFTWAATRAVCISAVLPALLVLICYPLYVPGVGEIGGLGVDRNVIISNIIAASLAALAVLLSWISSLIAASVAALISYPFLASSLSYSAYPSTAIWLHISPALAGALLGHKSGWNVLVEYLLMVRSKGIGARWIGRVGVEAEAQQWLHRAAIFQWLGLSLIALYYGLGSVYLPFAFAIFPFISCIFSSGLGEDWGPQGTARCMQIAVVMLGCLFPILLATEPTVHFATLLTCALDRSDRAPGTTSPFSLAMMMVVLTAMMVAAFSMHILPRSHRKGASLWLAGLASFAWLVSLIIVGTGLQPKYTRLHPRPISVSHVFNMGQSRSYIVLSSPAPGWLDREASAISSSLVCSRNIPLDFVSYQVGYGCMKELHDSRAPTREVGQPELVIKSDGLQINQTNDQALPRAQRVTRVSLDTGGSLNWALAIDATRIESFSIQAVGEVNVTDFEAINTLVSNYSTKGSSNGWHVIQSSSGRSGSTRFLVSLYWALGNPDELNSSKNSVSSRGKADNRHGGGAEREEARCEDGTLAGKICGVLEDHGVSGRFSAASSPSLGERHGLSSASKALIKLRVDHEHYTKEIFNLLEEVPSWCTEFSFGSSPSNVLFLSNLNVY